MCNPSTCEAETGGLSHVKRAGSLWYIRNTMPARAVQQDSVLNQRGGVEEREMECLTKM